MRLIIYCLLVLSALVFSACDSGVEIEKIAPENLVSVSSLISPQDSVVRVYVYQGKVLGEVARADSAIIKNAKVSIADGNISSVLVFNSKTNAYEINNQVLKITALKTYRLEVVTATGVVLKASCTIPSTPAEVVIEGVKDANDFLFNLNWPPLDKTEYFTFKFELVDVLFKPRLGATSGPTMRFSFASAQSFFDNKDRPSKPIESAVINAFVAEKVSLKTTFYSLDESTFKYLNTKAAANNWNSNTSGFVPNLREPQAIFSNIEGGVGVFSGYNQRIAIFKIL